VAFTSSSTSDIVIASDKATFLDPHLSIGRVDGLEPVGLAAKIGIGRPFG